MCLWAYVYLVAAHTSEDKMDYLKVGGGGLEGSAARNMEDNQLTLTSVISGNLALYEVRHHYLHVWGCLETRLSRETNWALSSIGLHCEVAIVTDYSAASCLTGSTELIEAVSSHLWQTITVCIR